MEPHRRRGDASQYACLLTSIDTLWGEKAAEDALELLTW